MHPSRLPEALRRDLIDRLPADAVRIGLPLPPGAAAVAICAALAEAGAPGLVLAVTAGPLELETLEQDWQTLNPDWPALLLHPPDDDETSDVRSWDDRFDTLQHIAAGETDAPTVLLTCLQGLSTPLPDPDSIARRTLQVAVGAPLEPDDPSARLCANGYARVDTVYQKGEFALRGGILDIWPPDRDQPLRLERFGAEIESLRTFDPATQRTSGRLTRASIRPARLDADDPGAQRLLSDCLPEGFRLLWLDPARLAEMAGSDTFPGAAPLPPRPNSPAPDRTLDLPSLLRTLRDRLPALECYAGPGAPTETTLWPVDWEPIAGLADTGAGGAPPDAMARARQTLLADLQALARDGHQVLLFADTPGVRDRLRETLGDGPPIELLLGPLSGGFALSGAACAIVAQPDLYGRRARPAPSPATQRGGTQAGQRIDRPDALRRGDLVVHVDHGIGRFIELGEIESAGQSAEVLTIEYAEGARLHVPTSQCHLLSRYLGIGGHNVKLHRLGGRRWQRERGSAEQAVRDLAAALLETQARRQTQAGLSFNVDPPWMHEFETAFPYPETADQMRTLTEIKADMAATRPMDRLICGDAGYGKTEVAMRAAFIAVMQGRQVAVLTPTTVLAEQHDRTFRDRLAPYPVRIDTLSRFRTPSQRQDILRQLATGAIDIVIGTHALLRPDIAFRDLGLLIIDEEQRFGVAHKERLKQIRSLVDVLTLTATPIPRTLYLSMTGARDMSLLQTPPRQRQAVDTQIVEDRDDVIREAILRELRREGQIFFLYNRVLTLPRMLRRLQTLVPEAQIGVAHGQMPSRELARVMQDFAEGRIDLLLCTTIVESGLDIPRANTILIHRADRFGIADLYQLRGRVGRSSRRAHALLLLPPHGRIDADARRRLQALQRHSGLGSGFQLALRDLEIRGAGNLLGAAQSGHIAAVGFSLYCQLLKRTVARLQGEAPRPIVDVAVQLDFIDLSPAATPDRGAALPYDYVSEDTERVALHKQLAEAAAPADLADLRDTLTDRFGPLPLPAERMLRLAELRILAAARGIRRMENRDERILLFRGAQPITFEHRLPRLRAKTVDARLKELRRLIGKLPCMSDRQTITGDDSGCRLSERTGVSGVGRGRATKCGDEA